MNVFYINLAVIVISFATTMGSLYGMGLNDHEKNSVIYTFSNSVFNISLIVLLISVIFIINNSHAKMACAKISSLMPDVEIETI